MGDYAVAQSYLTGNRENYYVRMVYDMIYWMTLNVIFMNIMFGIIIDTFAELRDQKNVLDDDMNNVCFICNLHRNEVIQLYLILTLKSSKKQENPSRDTLNQNIMSGIMYSSYTNLRKLISNPEVPVLTQELSTMSAVK